MNKDQVLSLVRTLLKVAGTALATHGATKVAVFINAEDVVGLIMAGVGVLWSHFHHSEDDTTPKPMVALSGLLLLLGLSVELLGCSQATLTPGGAYAPAAIVIATNIDGTTTTNLTLLQSPDTAFYAVDSAFNIAYGIVDTALKFERDNRAALWKLDPNIKHTLDGIRPTAWAVVKTYTAARSAYIANPTPTGLTTLQAMLSKIQALSSAAQAAIQTTSTKGQ